MVELFPSRVSFRQAAAAGSISRSLGVRLVEKKHPLRKLAAASNGSLRCAAVEPPIDASTAMAP